MNPQEKHDYEKISKERNAIVVKSNDMIENIRFDLSVIEQKILLYCISKIKRDDKYFKDISIDINNYCEVANIAHSGQMYSLIRDSVKNLRDKSWWINDGEKSTLFSWVDYAEIKERSGKIIIHFSSSLEPYLLEQSENFTQYALIDILHLNSKHGIRVYELLKAHLYQHRLYLSVSRFRELTGTTEKYPEYFELKRNVIDVALKEINSLTSLNVEFIPIRTGKRVTDLEFIINEKTDYTEIGNLYERRNKLLK